MVGLRPATPDDVPALAAMIADPSVAPWWPRYDAARLAAELAEDPDDQFVAVVDGAVAGLVTLSEEPDPDDRYGAVDLLLGPAFQGRGLGTLVVAAACAVLVDEHGHHRVTIDPSLADTRAIACYRRVGRDVGVLHSYERGPDGAWRDSLLMDLLAPELLRP